jgi:hypothetical protein
MSDDELFKKTDDDDDDSSKRKIQKNESNKQAARFKDLLKPPSFI